MQLTGKVALVTGAGSGIGKGAALLMAQEGAKIAAMGRTASQLNEVVEQIQAAGGEAIALIGDVSSVEQTQSVVQRTIDAWGRLDIVIANAGINGVWSAIENITPEEWDSTIDINLKGTFLTIKYAIPHLKKQGGAIVVVSSVNGTRMFSNTGASVYATSKAGQLAMTKMLAPEFAPHKVRINCICPGWIKTEIGDNTEIRGMKEIRWPVEYPQGTIPLTGGQPGTIEQTSQLILFLASDASSHITGTELWIDGGQSLIQG